MAFGQMVECIMMKMVNEVKINNTYDSASDLLYCNLMGIKTGIVTGIIVILIASESKKLGITIH